MVMDLIRKQISKVTKDPGSEEALRARLGQLAGQQGRSVPEEDFAPLIKYLSEYVESAPDLLDACLAAAESAGIAKAVRPIVRTAAQYFLEPEDYIPDEWGLLGLLDDAYLVHNLMNQVSLHHEHHAGVPLLPVSLQGATHIVRGIIGEPIIGQLDKSVAATLGNRLVEQHLGQLAMHNQTLSFKNVSRPNGPGTWGDEWEDEVTRVAAECGISVDF